GIERYLDTSKLELRIRYYDRETSVTPKARSQGVETKPGKPAAEVSGIRPSSPAYRRQLPSGAVVITNPFVSTAPEKTSSDLTDVPREKFDSLLP
ncbi:MAG: hypothetical protein ACYTG0_26920, partial [Planctomycetota bacterium]